MVDKSSSTKNVYIANMLNKNTLETDKMVQPSKVDTIGNANSLTTTVSVLEILHT